MKNNNNKIISIHFIFVISLVGREREREKKKFIFYFLQRNCFIRYTEHRTESTLKKQTNYINLFSFFKALQKKERETSVLTLYYPIQLLDTQKRHTQTHNHHDPQMAFSPLYHLHHHHHHQQQQADTAAYFNHATNTMPFSVTDILQHQAALSNYTAGSSSSSSSSSSSTSSLSSALKPHPHRHHGNHLASPSHALKVDTDRDVCLLRICI